MTTIHHLSGKVSVMLPTASQHEHDRAAAENRAIDRHNALALAALAKKQAARLAAVPQADERMTLALAGARKKLKILQRAQDERAPKVEQFCNAAAKALGEYQKLRTAKPEIKSDPRADAVEAAAAELRRKLPASFPSVEDARAFAGRNLPLFEATRATNALTDASVKNGKRITLAKKAFFDALDAVGYFVFSGGDSDGNVKHLIELGQ